MRYLKAWIPVVLIMMGIFWFSSIPNLNVFDAQSLSLGMKQFIEKYTYYIRYNGFLLYVIKPHPDYIVHKLGHIFVFGSLGIALYYAVGKRGKLAVLLTALFAASDELHQRFVTGRTSLFGDIVLDTLSAILFIFILRHIREKNSGRINEEGNRG